MPLDRRVSIALLFCVLAAGLAVRVHRINASMPYPLHIDERNISRPAKQILQTGDLNPHFFQKPSLPIYLTVAAYAVGFLDACQRSGIRNVEQIGSVSYPYYTHRRIVRPARILFAGFSIVSLALTGLIAFQVTGSSAQLFLAPLLLSASGWFLGLSWSYLNADVIGTTFALGAVAASFQALEGRRGIFDSAIGPGILCGLATASKYQLVVVVLSCLVCLWLSDAPRKALRSLGLVAAMLASYVAGVPYSLLDLPAFLNEVGYQLAAYGIIEPAGASELLRGARLIVRDFGALSLLAAAAGAIAIAHRDYRKLVALALLFASLSAALWPYRLYFARNVLPLFALYALVVSAGIGAIAGAAASFSAGRVRVAVALVAVLAVIGAGLPWPRIVEAYDFSADSRTRVVRWIREELPPGSRIFIPSELAMNAGSLKQAYDVVETPLEDFEPGDEPAYALVPTFANRRGPKGARAATLRAKTKQIGGVVLARLSGNPVLVGYWVPVPWGNPEIEVRRLPGIRRRSGT